MDSSANFKWIGFYTAFADALLPFKNDRTLLIGKIKQAHDSIHLPLPTLEKGGIPKDIDPFTIYGLFNKGITDDKRKAIIGAYIDEFQVSAEVPEEFAGIPVLNNMAAAFYAFEGTRGIHDIDNLWEVFEAALLLAKTKSRTDRDNFCRIYDNVLNQPRVKWNLTMGLYWIRPYDYLNLDSRNRWYMENPKNISADVVSEIVALKDVVPNGEKYLEIRDKCLTALAGGNYEYDSFPGLSYKAWVVSNEVNQQKKEKTHSNAAFLKWFKPVIQALRELGGSATPADTRKRIIDNEHLTEVEISETRGKSKVNKFENEVAFARSYLVKGGYIDNSVTGVWTLTELGKSVDMTDDLASKIFKDGMATMKVSHNDQSSTLGDADVTSQHIWLFAPGRNAVMWDEFYAKGIMALGWPEAGDLSQYNSKEEIKQALQEKRNPNFPFMHPKRMLWQFANEMNPGDIVFAKKGRSEIIGRGIVESDYFFDGESADFPNVRKVKWTHKDKLESPEMLAMQTLTDLTNYKETVAKISALFNTEDIENDDNEDGAIVKHPVYTAENFLDEVYIDEDAYERLVGLLQAKKNVILQGAPGVGKTFIAKRLAYSMMGVKDASRVSMIQFHQSYSYEDFIMGIRPVGSGFEVKKGVFYNFCKKAEDDSDNDYFFIIDEINRGNLSKIFGELFMLIENDKRGEGNKIQLIYSDEMFYIPDNVYVIGMMNTADRSLAMMDYALRRRFGFFDLFPAFSSESFKAYQESLDNRKFDRLIDTVEELNRLIKDDESLGEGFCIGHSYFCNFKPEDVTDSKLSILVEHEIIQLLKEYWYDEPKNVRDWSEKLRSAIK